jgi:bifunctional DNA-binding transcriptional regulator/antitoxin component of YhaV-PrlF toxin-antitoxin module
MSKAKVKQDEKGRTHLHIPAFLRDKFELKNGSSVEIDTDGTQIIVTRIGDEKR